MSKLTVLSGLPASGKSTLAKELLSHGNCIRVNRDLLRTMLHCDKFSGPNEGVTRDTERLVAKTLLELGTNVVVDDTNLTDGHIQSWKSLATDVGAKFEHVHLDTDVHECLKRNEARGTTVPPHVIVQMSMMTQQYPQPSQGFVVCDIDGTLADGTHRMHHIYNTTNDPDWKKNWAGFFTDAPKDLVRYSTVEILEKYATDGHPIIVVSARPETYRKDTEKWLENIFGDAGIPKYATLIMRKANDKREDSIVKKEIYDKYLKHYPIKAVIDDRPRVIRMWREQGLNVIDVGNQIEF